jgi:ubiquinone/menaquinone biosynthesis C-methylase UbiE
MTTTETWQVETVAAERYEAFLVPAIMSAWAPRLVAAAHVQSGDRVLDVACGTGIVSRTAAGIVGPSGHITGLDLNPGMLAVATRLRPDLDWRQGDAVSLPFPDASFDRVLCQFALMFFPDRLTALREMRRVLCPDGTLALSTLDAIETSPPYARQEEIIARLAGPEAAAIVHAPFVLHNPATIQSLLADAGFASIEVTTIQDTVTYPSIDAFLEGEFDATPLGTVLQAQDMAISDQARAEMAEALIPFHTPTGITYPIAAHIFSARSPRAIG